MLYSDDPCAMATTFTPASPRALNTRPAMPCWPFIPAPTTAMALMSRSTVMRATCSPSIPRSRKSFSRAFIVRSRSACMMAKETLYSEDDIEIM